MAWKKLYVTSTLSGLRGPRLANVERFCFFLGYPRSGHSLIGSALNAHPNVVISHELNAFRYVEKHFGRLQLFSLILRRDREFASIGRVWTGYDYTIPNQFQGEFTTLRVIGDKKGGRTTKMLSRQPDLVDRLRGTVRMPLRVVLVTRNPYDNLAAQVARRGLELSAVINWYERNSRTVADVRALLEPEEVFDLRYETFVQDPVHSLNRLCAFLGVEVNESYLTDCASVVHSGGRRRRDTIEWTENDRQQVQTLIGRYSFLSGYDFDD